MSEWIHLEISNSNGTTTRVGSWKVTEQWVHDKLQRESIGWHICLAMYEGASMVCVRRGQSRPVPVLDRPVLEDLGEGKDDE